MGKLIDTDRIIYHEIDEIGGEYEPYLGCSKSQIDNLPPVEVIPKADYENRLKADMTATLTELKHEIDKIPINPNTSERFRLGQATAYDKCELLVQQKIDKLNEE